MPATGDERQAAAESAEASGSGVPPDPDTAERTSNAIRDNNVLWDEWTAIHAASAFYDLDGFRRGGVRLADYEIAEVGDVTGRDLLHLQCHFGIDTLSWARLGARVTGADFSAAAIELARSLAHELGFPGAHFVRSDVYDLPGVLEGDFDVVYTSRGALNWLPDIRRWAQVVAHFVRPGGTFYVTELHPIANVFEDEGVASGELRLAYPYWEHPAPITFETQGSYADPTAQVAATVEHAGTTASVRSSLRSSRPAFGSRASGSIRSPPGSSTSWSRARTAASASRTARRASCRSSSRSGPRNPPAERAVAGLTGRWDSGEACRRARPHRWSRGQG